jgi:hypothetical protein
VKTTNLGASWIIQQNPHTFDIYTVHFIDNMTGWAAGDSSSILKTTNSGLNWIAYSTGANVVSSSIYFVDTSVGWIVGENGIILKSTTGGEPIGIHPISSEIPKSFNLTQNYPNPFNPSTKIKFSLPFPSEGGVKAPLSFGEGLGVRLVVYDLLGREVAILVNQQLKPGIYEVEWDGSNYPSGVYFYKFITESFTNSKRMVLVK